MADRQEPETVSGELQLSTEHEGPSDQDDGTATITDPAEAIRLGTMLQSLQAEVAAIELDDAGRRRLLEVHQRAVGSLKAVVSDDLQAELDDLGLPIQDSDASTAELRLAQAQVIGWLNGLFHGIQVALMSQRRGPAPPAPPLTPPNRGGQYL